MSAATSFFTIDTLQFAKRMQKAGLDQKIAEELAEAIKDTQSQAVDGLATKQDVRNIEQASGQDVKLLSQNIKNLEKELRQAMELMKKDIIIKLGSLLALGIGIIAALIKF